jgi:hypothetical protein
MSIDDVNAVGVTSPRQDYNELVGVLTSLRALLDAIDAGDCRASDAQRAHIAAGAEVVCQLAADVSPDGRRP